MRARLFALAGLLFPRRVFVGGVSLLVPPGVLDPKLFRTGAWFAERVAREVRPGQRVLDLGCGSGVVGALAARAGARVTAVDLDARAVAAARRNGIADARRGDLFAPLDGERFDLVCFNPPYLPGEPAGRAFGLALYGGPKLEVVTRFVEEVERHLAPGGRALVAWSDRAPAAWAQLGPRWARACAEAVEGEMQEIWELAAPPARTGGERD